MAENMASMTFRLDADLQAAFAAACKANDQTAAQELRGFMREYVRKHAQTVLPLTGSGKGKGK